MCSRASSRSGSRTCTRPRSTAASQVPDDRLLAETDCPYLAPQPVRGKQNEPAYVMHTLDTLAHVRKVAARELEAQIERNASACFGL